jgi:hypothetical protein
MSPASTIAHHRDSNLSARPVDSVALEAMNTRFARRLNREAGIAEASIEWS